MGKEVRSDRGMERSVTLVGLICPLAAQDASSSGQCKLLCGKVQDEHIFIAPLFKLRKWLARCKYYRTNLSYYFWSTILSEVSNSSEQNESSNEYFQQ